MKYPVREVLKAATRLAGCLVATRYVWRPFSIVGVDRCRFDGRIVLDTDHGCKTHLGHMMEQPVRLSVFEVFLVWVRGIR